MLKSFPCSAPLLAKDVSQSLDASNKPPVGSSPEGSALIDIDPRVELTLAEQVAFYVDMWKKAVEVQQHFNDIEWRIRGLALTVATFAIGAAGVAAKDGTRVGWFSLGALVVVVGLILWYAFYFVDRVWYHPLLKAAVDQGTEIENEIRKYLPKAALTHTITTKSGRNVGKLVSLLSRKQVMRSEDKLVWFYTVGAAAFAISAVALQWGVLISDGGAQKPQRMDVRIIQPEQSTSVAPAGLTDTPHVTPTATVATSEPSLSSPSPAVSPS